MSIYNMKGLVEASGMPERSIRFYIVKGQLPPPEGQKRGSYYTDKHLDRLRLIKKMASQGVPLDRMQEFLDKPAESSVPDTWHHIQVAEGVQIHCRPNVLTEPEQQKAIEAVRSIILGNSATDLSN